MHGFGSGRCRRAGISGTDGRKIKMLAFYPRHEATLAPQSEQVWVGLSLTSQSVTADSPAFRNGPLPVTTAWPPARRCRARARAARLLDAGRLVLADPCSAYKHKCALAYEHKSALAYKHKRALAHA